MLREIEVADWSGLEPVGGGSSPEWHGIRQEGGESSTDKQSALVEQRTDVEQRKKNPYLVWDQEAGSACPHCRNVTI